MISSNLFMLSYFFFFFFSRNSYISWFLPYLLGTVPQSYPRGHLPDYCCCCLVASVVSDSVRPHRRQPTGSPIPEILQARILVVGCHFLLQCMKVKSESEVAQSCLTLSDPMDCSLQDSSIHRIFQAREPEWGAIAFSLSDYSPQ